VEQLVDKEKLGTIKQSLFFIGRIIHQLEKYLDHYQIVEVCHKQQKMADLFFQIMSQEAISEAVVKKFLVQAFRYAVDSDNFDIAVLILNQNQVKLFDQSQECIESVLTSLNRSQNYYEYKFYLIQVFITFFKYKHVDYLLNTLDNRLNDEVTKNFLSHNMNPLKLPHHRHRHPQQAQEHLQDRLSPLPENPRIHGDQGQNDHRQFHFP